MPDPGPRVLAVWVTFEFNMRDTTPSEISGALGLGADGSMLNMPPALNAWWINSDLISNDAIDHLRDLLEMLAGKEDRIRPEWNPEFTIEWQSPDYLPDGGQRYPADVLAGIARCKAILTVKIADNKAPPAAAG